ncbi:hypothetical protein TRFO_41510 [Tritrichomonas foetus]|uniref:Uncharacterized protein n=1 Tax=Tritrichomonas foetus TaxID=1144522 RepID=A0A1J4L1A7_9EUKA|nr:hypothetical protein TRFO_41510 [Tritrichomonas foetus]|eukprot:OHT16864.1 hypothetical protein TRFO_41510 [Tritrichomonas foetus]
MTTRFSMTNSPRLKKASSIYKQSPKKKYTPTKTMAPTQTSQYENIIPEDVIESTTTPKKSPRTSSKHTTHSSVNKTRTNIDTFFNPNRPKKTLEELRDEYITISHQYNDALEQREALSQDIISLDHDLQQEYKKQSSLVRQLQQKEQTAPSK